MTTAAQPELETEVRITSDGTLRIILRGCLDAKTVAGCWNDLGRLRLAAMNKIEVEASEMRSCDSSGIAFPNVKRRPKAGPLFPYLITVGDRRHQVEVRRLVMRILRKIARDFGR